MHFSQCRYFCVSSLCGLFLLASCTTLRNTPIQQVFNREGSFYCAPVKLPFQHPETDAEKETSRIRCYQDEWIVSQNEVRLHRIFFQSNHCDSPLGKIEAEGWIEGSELTKIRCFLVKDEVNWIGEQSGRCVLDQLPLHKHASIGNLKACPKAVPVFCLHPSSMKSSVKIDLASPQSITVSDHDHQGAEICSRNPQ